MQSILFIELLGGIGDVLIALPAMQALGRAYPQAKLTVLTFAPGGELIKGDPLIHAVVCLDRQQNHEPHLARNAVEALLNRDRFDLIVSDTNYDGIDTLIQQSSASRVVTNLWRSPPSHQKVSDRFLQILQAEALITPDHIAPTQLHLLPAERLYAQEQLSTIHQPIVVLYPDAGMAIKRWSAANFVQVGQALQQQYNATIVVPIGSDVEQSAQIAREIGGTAIVWAQGTLRELAALMSTAAVVIASDTGPARIAAALQTPTITLFGPSWHDRYGQPAPHINLQGCPDCPERNSSNFTLQGCWYSGDCPFDRWQTCLEDISPAQVLAAAALFLEPSGSTRKRATSELKALSSEGSQSSLEPSHLPPELTQPGVELSQPTFELSQPSLEPTYPTAALAHPTVEPGQPIVALSQPIVEPSHPTVALSQATSELGTSSLELDPSNLELKHLTSALGMSSLEDKQSNADITSLSAHSRGASFEASATQNSLRLGFDDELSRIELRSKAKLKTQNSIFHPAPWNQWSLARNILVMRLDNIGDVLMTSPALCAIKEALPAARLTLMASPGGSQAAALLPWVDEVLTCRVLWQNLGKLAFDPDREGAFIQTLRDRQFDAAIIFTSFSQTPHSAGFMCYLAGIPLRLGQSKEWGGAVLTTEVKAGLDTLHQVERNLRLIEAVGFPVSDRSLRIQIPTAAQHSATAKLLEQGLQPHEPYIVLNPWTSCQSRNYSIDRFALAAQQLAAKTGYRIVVTGVANDRAHSASLLELLGSCAIDLIGQTSLAELAALIDNATLMVSNNTSTMHLADATRTPSVILFAGTEYECQWQPRHTAARLLRQPTDCSPCYAFTCPFNLECLDIPLEQVVEAGLSLLQTSLPVR